MKGARTMRVPGFTVIELIRAAGKQPNTELDVALGGKVRNAWVAEHGELPAKDLRRKTNARKPYEVHCLAVYPENFRATAEAIVTRELADIDAAQLAQPGLPL